MQTHAQHKLLLPPLQSITIPLRSVPLGVVPLLGVVGVPTMARPAMLAIAATMLTGVGASTLSMKGTDSEISMNGAVLTASCRDGSGASVRHYTPTFGGSWDPLWKVEAVLNNVALSCAGVGLYTPCAPPQGQSSWPKLFSCRWSSVVAGNTNAVRIGQLSAEYTELPVSPLVSIRCPVPGHTEFLAMTEGVTTVNKTLRLEFFHQSSSNTEEALAFENADGASHGVVTFLPVAPVNVLTVEAASSLGAPIVWSFNSDARDAGGRLDQVMDTVDRTSTTNWPDYCMQTGFATTSSHNWFQIELPNALFCHDAAIIAYPGDNHMPTTDGDAYISASNDGATWVTAAEWATHAGSDNRAWLTAAQSSSYKYSTVIADMDTYGIKLTGTLEGACAACVLTRRPATPLRAKRSGVTFCVADRFLVHPPAPYKYWRMGGKKWMNKNMLPCNVVLRCHVPPPSAPPLLNVLTPAGFATPEGSLAGPFAWSFNSDASDAGGRLSQVMDTIDRTSTTNWPDYCMQTGFATTSSHNWFQVELPEAVACLDMAIIAYPGDNHMPTTDGGAYISASNDGSNWVTAAKWSQHAGSDNRAWLTAAQSSSYKYSTVIADMDTYGIKLTGSAGVKYKYWRAGGHKWMNQNMLPCNVILQCWAPSPPAASLENVLTPSSKLGDASTSSWWSFNSDARDAGGSFSNVVDEVDRTSTPGWPDYCMQTGFATTSSHNWFQVELPEAVACLDMAIIAYPGDNHMPTTDGGAYISASNDGSNWVTAAKWTTHPGSDNRAWLTAAQSSSYKYSTVIADMDAYGIRLVGSAGVKYKYWRAGGHKWMNQNMLPCNVILRCYV